jgi:hypothetical protein
MLEHDSHDGMTSYYRAGGLLIGRGRDGDCPPPPAQTRACRVTAYGSCLRS